MMFNLPIHSSNSTFEYISQEYMTIVILLKLLLPSSVEIIYDTQHFYCFLLVFLVDPLVTFMLEWNIFTLFFFN